MTLEPISMLVGKKAIDLAGAKVDQLLKEATDKNKKEVERCTKYLEACGEAIRGLEQEYDEILVQTVNCPDAADAVGQLRTRILNYLHVDKLRANLRDALKGLTYYQDIFDKSASSRLEWPWKRANKEQAARDFADNLRQLTAYFNRLNEEDLPYRAAGTGVGQAALHGILQQMDVPVAFQTSSLSALGEKYLGERSKEPMFQHIDRIRLVIEKMQHEFL